MSGRWPNEWPNAQSHRVQAWLIGRGKQLTSWESLSRPPFMKTATACVHNAEGTSGNLPICRAFRN